MANVWPPQVWPPSLSELRGFLRTSWNKKCPITWSIFVIGCALHDHQAVQPQEVRMASAPARFSPRVGHAPPITSRFPPAPGDHGDQCLLRQTVSQGFSSAQLAPNPWSQRNYMCPLMINALSTVKKPTDYKVYGRYMVVSWNGWFNGNSH